MDNIKLILLIIFNSIIYFIIFILLAFNINKIHPSILQKFVFSIGMILNMLVSLKISTKIIKIKQSTNKMLFYIILISNFLIFILFLVTFNLVINLFQNINYGPSMIIENDISFPDQEYSNPYGLNFLKIFYLPIIIIFLSLIQLFSFIFINNKLKGLFSKN
jgi:hypothetical protein